jgi:hypothetical protein
MGWLILFGVFLPFPSCINRLASASDLSRPSPCFSAIWIWSSHQKNTPKWCFHTSCVYWFPLCLWFLQNAAPLTIFLLGLMCAGTHTPSPSPFLSDPHLNNCLGYHFNAAKHVVSAQFLLRPWILCLTCMVFHSFTTEKPGLNTAVWNAWLLFLLPGEVLLPFSLLIQAHIIESHLLCLTLLYLVLFCLSDHNKMFRETFILA